MGRPYRENISDQPFGQLTALTLAPYNGHHRRWICQCECGEMATVDQNKLTSLHTTSCGCLRKEVTAERGRKAKTHGQSKSGYYTVWRSMLARCGNPNNIGYDRYGGRGIAVCDRWRNSFENFRDDMGPRPEGHEIDRKDTNGNYGPDNCHWVTAAANTRNRRVTPTYTYDSRTMALGDWAEETGVPYLVLKDRIRHGWTISRAIEQPIRPRKESVPFACMGR